MLASSTGGLEGRRCPGGSRPAVGVTIDSTGWETINLTTITTRSVSKQLKTLTKGLVQLLENKEYHIKKWILTTFNDKTDDIEDNVKLRIVTGNVKNFSKSLSEIKFHGGGDYAERATQGALACYGSGMVPVLMLPPGLLRTMEETPQEGLVVMFTDHQTKDLHLEARLLELVQEKELRVVVVLVPRYYGEVGDPSWNLYMNISDGRTFDMKDVSKEHLVEQVAGLMEEPCAPGEGLVPWLLSSSHRDGREV